LCVELKLNNIPFTRQKIYSVFYKSYIVGKFLADIVVDNKVIVELKAVPFINNNMLAQLINYLHVSKIPVGYIINFRNALIEFRRLVI
jgi:GxxExxY protein